MPCVLCVGDLNADITIATTSAIAKGSDTTGSVALASGGSAANVAAVAAASGISARFVGVVGDDLLGRVLVDELERHGVDVRPVVRRDSSSRAIAALIDPNGDRSMVSDLAGATTLSVDDIEPGWFDDVDWLHLTAYSWFPDGGDVVFARLVGSASERGIPWSVDPSSAQMLSSTHPIADALDAFSGAAMLFPNRDEAAVLTDLDDPAESAVRLLDIATAVVVTCGAHGVVVARRGREVFQAAAHDADVVNALGAGDAFAGAFIAAGLAGFDDHAATQAGLSTAARAVGRRSAR